MVARLSAREFAAVQASAASSGPRGVAITDGDGADLPLADGAARGPGDAGGLTLAAAKDGPDDGQGPGGNNGALADVDDVGASLDVLANSMTGKRRVEETGPLGGYAIPAGFAVCILLGFGIAYLRTR